MLHAEEVSPDEIETLLIAEAEQAARDGQVGWADREWTRQLLSRFSKRGREMGFSVCATGNDQYGRGEWLYDMVWLRRDSDGQHIKQIPLILESEWNKFGWILEDFEKLIIGRAQHRVMVFQDATVDNVKSIVQRLLSFAGMSEVTQPGDRYLFLGLAYTELNFVASVVVLR